MVQSSLSLPMILFVYVLLVVLALAITSVRARKLAVLVAVLAANAIAMILLFAAFKSDDAKVAIERVPGGVAAVVWQDNSHEPDLIVSGLSRQSYPLHERVFQPMLRRHGVTCLSRLIVLGADYDALKDVLQLSAELQVDTLFAGRDLQASIEDILRHAGDSIVPTPALYFGNHSLPPDQEGYFLSENLVTWRRGGVRIDFIDRPSLESLAGSMLTPGSTLVIGRQWRPVADDWIRLRQAGYEKIICANVEQPDETAWPDAELNFDALPDFVHDLSRNGPVAFNPAR